MSLARFSRQSHRGLSIVFTLTVALNFAWRAAAQDEPPAWVTYAPLPPLFLHPSYGVVDHRLHRLPPPPRGPRPGRAPTLQCAWTSARHARLLGA